MKNKLLVILLIFFSFQLAGEKYTELKPSSATLSMKAGDMEVWLKKKENNIWEMGSNVDGGRVFKREEISVFEKTLGVSVEDTVSTPGSVEDSILRKIQRR